MIFDVDKSDYLELIELWEASVRATHDFLPEAEIEGLKPVILNEYFDAVTLKCIKNADGKIIGFIGLSADNIEMLFIHPSAQGQGGGSKLCQYAVQQKNIIKVDVNEQNPRAILFYEKMGFQSYDRSELDEQGMPYPILHMKC